MLELQYKLYTVKSRESVLLCSIRLAHSYPKIPHFKRALVVSKKDNLKQFKKQFYNDENHSQHVDKFNMYITQI